VQSQEKRILKILDMLGNERRVLQGEGIAVSLGVSSRTIRNDIKECNTMLKGQGAEILAEPGVGYTLKIYDKKCYSAFRTFQETEGERNYIIPSDHSERISFIIAELLVNALCDRPITEMELADKMYISLSTLKKYMSDIKKCLDRYGIIFVVDKHGIILKGEESQLRYCISEYVFNRNTLGELSDNPFYKEMFSATEIEIVRQILLEHILKYKIHLTDVAFRNLLIHVLITMKRADSRSTVEYDKAEIEAMNKNVYFPVARDIVKALEQTCSIDISSDVYYLTQHFISSKKLIDNSLDMEEKEDYRSLVEAILNQIRTLLGVNLSGDEELISGLMIHLCAAVPRLRFNMNIRNEILESIKQNFPLAFEMAVVAGKVLSSWENLSTNENEMGFLAIHFGAAMERRKSSENAPWKAIIACGTGLSTAMFVKSRLQRKFGSQLQIVKVSPVYEIKQEDIENVDFIFTTVPMKQFSSPKIIMVEPILTEKDLQGISLVLSGKQEEKTNFLRKDLFFVGMKAQNKQEALDRLTDSMLERQYIDVNIKKSIFERERCSSTEVGNLVAIPHALENPNEDAVIAVAVLDKPILWDKQKVQVIFLLSIPKHKAHVWEPVFERLYEYVLSGYGVNELIRSPDFDVLKEKIEG